MPPFLAVLFFDFAILSGQAGGQHSAVCIFHIQSTAINARRVACNNRAAFDGCGVIADSYRTTAIFILVCCIDGSGSSGAAGVVGDAPPLILLVPL